MLNLAKKLPSNLIKPPIGLCSPFMQATHFSTKSSQNDPFLARQKSEKIMIVDEHNNPIGGITRAEY